MFFDDLIIAAKDITDHDRILEQVLRRARKNNVKFNTNKFQFRVSEVNCVGNVVSAGGLKPDPEKVRSITEYPKPENKQDLQRFFGKGHSCECLKNI